MADKPLPHFKTCTKCGMRKAVAEFARDRSRRDGLTYWCKLCRNPMGAAYRAANPEKEKARSARYRQENAGKVKAHQANYRAANKEKIAAYNAEWGRKNVERKNATNRAWRRPGYSAAATAKWRAQNPGRAREIGWKATAKRRGTAKGRLSFSISSGIRSSIVLGSKRGRRAFALLGYSVDELMAHLERQFQPGMSWENYGRTGWHVDHKIPLAAFVYETPDDPEFKRAWALSNLQPLWWRDNLSKGARLPKS